MNQTIEILSSDDDKSTNDVIDELVNEETQSLSIHTAKSNTVAKLNNNDDNMLIPIKTEASYPDFYHTGVNSDKVGNILESEFLNEDWMTNELVEELFNFVPPSKSDDKDQNVIDNDLKTKFTEYCSHIFPIGREFANYRQLDQYLSLFLKSWKIRKNRDGFSFKCFYANNHRVYTPKNSFAARKKCTIRKLKTQINCPFVIRWSCPGIKDKSQAPIFRKVYITQCNPNHNCGICVESFRIAMRMSKSSGKFDLNTLSNVLRVTKIDPFLPAKHLRSLLETCIPSSIYIDSKFLSNFRRALSVLSCNPYECFDIRQL